MLSLFTREIYAQPIDQVFRLFLWFSRRFKVSLFMATISVPHPQLVTYRMPNRMTPNAVKTTFRKKYVSQNTLWLTKKSIQTS